MRLDCEPRTVSDLVFPSLRAKSIAEMFVDGTVSAICLEGPPGTGKSTAVRVLIRSLIPDVHFALDVIVLNAAMTNDMAAITAAADAARFTGQNSLGARVLVIEEVDRLTPTSAKALKGIFDDLTQRRLVVPILATTNNRHKLDPALVSRFRMVHWDNQPGEALVNRALQVLHDNGQELSVERVRQLVQHNGSDLRRLFEELLPLELHMKRRREG